MATICTMQDSYPIEAVDLCEYQDYDKNSVFRGIDFKAAKATRPSLRWLLIKMGEGTWNGYNDLVFEAQIGEAQDAGFDTSPYHFHHMELTPAEQAAYIRGRMHGTYRGNMPIMLDFEDEDQARFQHPTVALTAQQIKDRTPTALLMHDNMRDTLDAVAQIDGVAPIGYSGAYYMDWFMWLAQMAGRDLTWTKKYPWQIATYRTRQMYLPYGVDLSSVILWQWTSTPVVGWQVNGFPNPGALDMNFFLKDEAAYQALKNGSFTPPTPVELTDHQKVEILWAAYQGK